VVKNKKTARAAKLKSNSGREYHIWKGSGEESRLPEERNGKGDDEKRGRTEVKNVNIGREPGELIGGEQEKEK